MRFGFAIIIVFVLSIASLAMTDVPGPKVMRKQLLMALNNRGLTDSLYKTLTEAPNKSPLNTSYLGVVEALKAKHTWNPYYKVKYLNDAEKTLQLAVNREPDNMEIRFMRYSIEHNVPGFLGYNKHLTDDREEMIKQLNKKYYATADHEVVVAIIKFLLDSKRCTPHETETLHKQLAAQK